MVSTLWRRLFILIDMRTTGHELENKILILFFSRTANAEEDAAVEEDGAPAGDETGM